MALSDQNKADVIWYLGYPGKVLEVGSTHYDPILVGRLNNLSAEIETQVTNLLERLEKLDIKFDKASGRFLVKKVGDIELNTDEFSLLTKAYKRWLRQLSSLLDIPMAAGTCGGGATVNLCV